MADMESEDLTEITNSEFITEIKDDLELLEPDLLTMEEKGSGVDAELINHAFRAIHSIKGGAGFCGLKDLGALSHSMENVLMRIRDGRLLITSEIVDTLLTGLDKLKLMVDALESGDFPSYEDDLKALEAILASQGQDDHNALHNKNRSLEKSSEQLSSFETEKTHEPEKFVMIQTAEESFFKSKGFHLKKDELEKAVDDGNFIYAVHFDSNRDLVEKKRSLADLFGEIQNTGKILFSELAPGREAFETKENQQGFNLVLSTILDIEFVTEVLEVPLENIYLFESPLSAISNLCHDMDNGSGEKLVTQGTFKEPALLKTAREGVKEKKKIPETIRVNVELITRLMNFAGELVLSRNQLRPLIEPYTRENSVLNDVMQKLDMITTEIQEDIMQIRMQPVGNVLGRFKRIVRDMAKKLEKKVDYILEGEDVELDRTILEGLTNPMNHLMRNCVDHGIESPDQRETIGKPKTGTIWVKAFHQGGNVHIHIIDDGKGMDPETIALAAVKRGVVTQTFADTMTDKEKIDLIFSPGFSTSDKVTDVSGRGVGMDVVKTNIEKLRGQIDIYSIPGQSTSVQIIIPLTLAIVSALIVGIDNFRFAIPQVNVSEVVFLKSDQFKKNMEKIGSSEVMRLRGRLLSVVRLRRLLDIDTCYVHPETGQRHLERRIALADRRNSDPTVQDVELRSRTEERRKNDVSNGLYIVVVKVGLNSFGLCVEALFDNEEIVVKPLSDYIKACRCFSGATILGDGGVIMILDPSGMARHADLRFAVVSAEEERRRAQEAKKNLGRSEEKNVIVFSNAENEFFAIGLDTIARLEAIKSESIHRIGGLKFMEYHGTSISLFNLEDFIPVNPCVSGLKELYVIIPKGGSVKSGIIVSGIVDTMSVFQTLQKKQPLPAGVEGTAFVQGRLVQFLDMDKIVTLMENKTGEPI